MDIFAVIVAAAVGFAIGALWYGVFRRQWVANSGVPTDATGAPTNGGNPVTYLGAYICILLVTGMMRHIFSMAEIDTMLKGLMAGGGIRGGQVFGSTDRFGEFPDEKPLSPADVTRTVYHAMGIDSLAATDREGRPFNLLDEGRPLVELF